ncbi:hypothetical protein GQ44DRAFT_766596 [Phaeosphaeriaceae sp. PMI808]|nr:hypothetical protein GQ44DRAFT_766596 [Phaeosphaeriaceae sp. PMI808]
MSFLTKPASILRSGALRPALSTIPRARLQVRFATQDYGSGAGNPAGEKPEKQGANPSENIEHPGPPPPKVAKGKSSSSPDNDDSPNQNSSSTSSQSKSNDSASKSGSNSDSKKGAQPKILNAKVPSKGEESEDVKKHNREMENRTDKAHERVSNDDTEKDKVPKKFWSGQGGRDSEP